MKLLTSQLLDSHKIKHGFFDAVNVKKSSIDSDQQVETNRQQLLAMLNIDSEKLVFACDLAHGDAIKLVAADEPNEVHGFDGLISNHVGVGLALSTADCLPILMADSKNGAVGIVHAGWRGAVLGTAEAGVTEMIKAFGSQPKNLIAAFGPRICVDCYQVGPEVAEQFLPAARTKKSGQDHVDIAREVSIRLQNIGLQQIDDLDVCVYENHDYFSHRRQKEQAGRNMSIISP